MRSSYNHLRINTQFTISFQHISSCWIIFSVLNIHMKHLAYQRNKCSDMPNVQHGTCPELQAEWILVLTGQKYGRIGMLMLLSACLMWTVNNILAITVWLMSRFIDIKQSCSTQIQDVFFIVSDLFWTALESWTCLGLDKDGFDYSTDIKYLGYNVLHGKCQTWK